MVQYHLIKFGIFKGRNEKEVNELLEIAKIDFGARIYPIPENLIEKVEKKTLSAAYHGDRLVLAQFPSKEKHEEFVIFSSDYLLKHKSISNFGFPPISNNDFVGKVVVEGVKKELLDYSGVPVRGKPDACIKASELNRVLGTIKELDSKNVEKILIKAKEKNIAVLHDEAYFEFSKITAKDLIEQYNNLYIIRTFAKAFGLVSARAGYLISQENNVRELLKIRGPYDVNMFAKTAVLAALEDTKYMEDYVREVMEGSKPKLESFLKEKGIFSYPSRANFLLLKFPNPDQVIDALKSKGILVRPKSTPDKKKAVRVSIGTLKDMEQFVQALERVLDRGLGEK